SQRERRRTRGKRKGQCNADGDREHSTHPYPPRSPRVCHAIAAPPISLARSTRARRVAHGRRRWYAFGSHASVRVPARRAADAAGPAIGTASAGGPGGTGGGARAVRRAVAPPGPGGGREEALADPP